MADRWSWGGDLSGVLTFMGVTDESAALLTDGERKLLLQKFIVVYQNHITIAAQNLALLVEREMQYVMSVDVPLGLVKEKRETLEFLTKCANFGNFFTVLLNGPEVIRFVLFADIGFCTFGGYETFTSLTAAITEKAEQRLALEKG